MFNEQQKLKYITFEEKNAEAIRRYFNRLSEREEECGIDIADMDEQSLIETLLSLKISKESYLSQLLSLLKGYVNWVILNKKGGSNAIFSINAERLKSREIIASKMIKDPDELKIILDNALDKKGYINRNKKTRLMFWLLYSGLTTNEIITLKKDSLDYEKESVMLANGNLCKIRKEAIDLWESCVNMAFIEKKNGRAEYAKDKAADEYSEIPLVDNDFLFRNVVSKIIKPDMPQCRNSIINTVKSVFDNLSDDIKIKVSPENIRASGLFYDIYMREKAGEHITPEILLSHFRINIPNKSALITKKRSLQIEYEDWKFSFDYM